VSFVGFVFITLHGCPVSSDHQAIIAMVEVLGLGCLLVLTSTLAQFRRGLMLTQAEIIQQMENPRYI